MGAKVYGVIDCNTHVCMGAYLSLEQAIRQAYKYKGWTAGYGFQVVEWDDKADPDQGYNVVPFVSVPDEY